MWSKSRYICVLLLGLMALAAPAQVIDSSAPVPMAGEPVQPEVVEDPPVEVDADSLDYDAEGQVLTATGNVEVRQGNQILRADRVVVYQRTREVRAVGNVVLEKDGDLWEGPKLSYNFRTRQGDFGTFDAFTDPYYISAEKSQRISSREFELSGVTLSTCEGPQKDFRITAREARLTDGKTLRAKHVTFFMGPVPFLYLPYLKKELGGSNWDFTPGYSSEMGAFLLSAYNYRLTDTVKAATRMDYRAKRGVGIGEDIYWKDPEGQYKGEFQVYYADDQEPFDDDEEEALYGDIIDSDRSRVHLSHYQQVNDRAYAIAELNWLSDPDVLEDFFDDEFRHVGQPDNRVSLTHRGDWYTATLLVEGKLNDFYDAVARLPEVSFDINRIAIKDTPLYYEGTHEGGYLKRDYADDVPTNATEGVDYDSMRFNSANRIYWPTRQFGFLSLIPRAGYSATYYSETPDVTTSTQTVFGVDAEGFVVGRDVVSSATGDGGADVRNLFELGFETSFKAFKVMNNHHLWGNYEGLRHVVEPFTDYTYIPTPNLRPDDLYTFDSIDTWDKRNDLRFGVRNKFQTRRKGKFIHNLFDGEVYTTYDLDPEDDDDDFGPLFADLEFRPVGSLKLDVELAYNYEESLLAWSNTRLRWTASDHSRVNAEYIYRDDVRDQIATSLDLFPKEKWSFDTYWRYDLEDGEMEEQRYGVSTKTDCMGIGVGYRQIERDESETDQQVWVTVWLLAFPDSVVALGR